MPKKIKKVSSFFLTFIGEYVQLIGEFTMQAMDGQFATVSGYLLDMDDDYFYIGPSAEEVNLAVRIDKVYTMQIVPKKDTYQEILESLGVPDDVEDVN